MTMKIPGKLPDFKIGATAPAAAGTTIAGGAQEVDAGQTVTLAQLTSLDETTWTVVTTATACEGFGIDDTDKAHHQPMVRITSGTSQGGHTDIVPANKKIVVVGNSVRVDAFIQRQDGLALQKVSSQMSAFIVKGAPDAEAYPSRWIEPDASTTSEPGVGASGMISSLPGVLKSVLFTNHGSAEGTVVLLDSKQASGLSLHNSPIVFTAIVAPGGFVGFDLPRGRNFYRGLGWLVSSTRAPLTLDGTQLIRVDAEIGSL